MVLEQYRGKWLKVGGMGKREILLLLAGVGIFAVTLWRQNQLQQWEHDPTRKVVAIRALAPRFTLADHNRNVVKLERMLGRHQVVLVFFDAELGVDRDPRTKSLIENFEAINRAGFEIIAVGTATPYANEEAEKRLGVELPFPVVTDIDINDPAPSPAHRKYGLFDLQTGKPSTGLFLIERDGTLPIVTEGTPIAVKDEAAALKTLAEGKWPGLK
ncbi:peroxiredoxin family protein [Thalassoglobus sp.]|uniref:peroxiredoxin family protein n=1 Tax=Thalassoglobus sp. TaxID=2795869 RepID=UPI003AA8C598